MPTGTALLLRAARGYRGFPALDDLAYLPLARAAIDPTLYPRDVILHQFVLHAPAWVPLVRVFDSTIGLPAGFWLLTVILSVATAAAAYRLMRALGGTGLLLAVVMLLGFVGRVVGVGRGLYDGAFGDSFHAQWLALTLLLWSYDAVVRGASIGAGLFLGLAGLAHPVVGFHGAIAILVASVAARDPWRRLATTALVAALVGAPLIVGLGRKLGAAANATWPAARIVRDGFIFRAPHEFAMQETTLEAALAIALLAAAGLASLRLVSAVVAGRSWRAMLGLLTGHLLILVAAVVVHGPWEIAPWTRQTVVPYLLSLTRTSPLVLALAAICIGVALERRGDLRGKGGLARELLWLGLFLAVAVLLTLFVAWSPGLAAAFALAVAGRAVARQGRGYAFVITGYLMAAAGGAIWCWRHDRRYNEPAPDAAGLYAWAQATPKAALFIVPPGLEGFREYARRSVYVEFKLFPASTPAAIPEWRTRLETVAMPDRLAREALGWPGVPLWDRSYAARNTPRRIVELLRATGADFFVWDRAGLAVPPYITPPAEPVASLAVAYRNERFVVYRLSEVADGGR